MIEPVEEMPFVWRLFAKLFPPSVRQATVVLFDQGFRSATTFLTGVLVARYCSVSEHGFFVVAFSVILLMANLQETLIATPLYVFLPARRGRFREEYQRCITIWQGLLAIIAVGIMLGVGFIADALGKDFGRLLIYISPVVAAVMIRDYMRQSYFARLKPARALWVDVPIAILQIGTIVALAYFNKLDSKLALITLGLVALAVCLVPFILKIDFRKKINPHYLAKVAQRHVLFGRWVVASKVAYWIALGSFPFMISVWSNTYNASVFGACQRISLLFSPMMAGMVHFLLPILSHRFSRVDKSSNRKLIMVLTAIIFAGAGLLTLAIFLYGREILYLFYNDKYAQYSDVLQILTVAVLIHNVSFCVGMSFVARRKPWLELVAYGIASVLTLSIGIYLIRNIGVKGAAIGYLLCTSCVTVIRWAYFLSGNSSLRMDT